MRALLSAAVIASCTLTLFGQQPGTDATIIALCSAAKAKPLVAPQLSGPPAPAELPKCDEQALYYGAAAKPNYAAALQCGWWQRAHPRPSIGNMFYGPGVLTMLYANGYGVPRNLDLALRFACENDWAAPAEMDGRVEHLQALQNQPSSKPFDMCDDITSGLSMGTCQGIDSMKRSASRDSRIAQQASLLPENAKAMLPVLQAAEKAFEDARVRGEMDQSGTARGMFALQEQSTLSDQFLINLQRFQKRDIPGASAQDLQTLDGKLNAVYQQLQHIPESEQFGTVKPAGIRDTERAWLHLVDAWVAFSKTAYPGLTETSLRAQLIRLRLHQLQSLKPTN